MNYNLYDLVKMKKDYVIKTSDSSDQVKTGWIGMIIELYENNYALIEFDENKYCLQYNLLEVNLNEVELYKKSDENLIK